LENRTVTGLQAPTKAAEGTALDFFDLLDGSLHCIWEKEYQPNNVNKFAQSNPSIVVERNSQKG
jgi:hypothetical protein